MLARRSPRRLRVTRHRHFSATCSAGKYRRALTARFQGGVRVRCDIDRLHVECESIPSVPQGEPDGVADQISQARLHRRPRPDVATTSSSPLGGRRRGRRCPSRPVLDVGRHGMFLRVQSSKLRTHRRCENGDRPLRNVNRPGFGSASFGRMDYAPSVSAGVPAACVEDA